MARHPLATGAQSDSITDRIRLCQLYQVNAFSGLIEGFPSLEIKESYYQSYKAFVKANFFGAFTDEQILLFPENIIVGDAPMVNQRTNICLLDGPECTHLPVIFFDLHNCDIKESLRILLSTVFDYDTHKIEFDY